MIQLYKYVTNRYDANFKLQLDYQSMLEMSYATRRNKNKLCRVAGNTVQSHTAGDAPQV